MNHRTMKQIFGTVAGLTAVVYLSLVMVAAGCLFMHAAPSGGHDHHAQDSAHSPLCAWSCQALSGGGLIAEPPVVTAWAAETAVIPQSSIPISSTGTDLLRARAPPQSILS